MATPRIDHFIHIQEPPQSTTSPPSPAAATARRLDHVDSGGSFSWLSVAGMLAFLTFNSVMAVYRSKHDAATVVFVANAYLDLVLLFCCLWLLDRAAPGSPWRDRLKASVWTLTTLLTFSFAYMVVGTAAGLTLPVALLVWIIAAATGIGAFSAFFDRQLTRVNQPLDGLMLPPV